MRILKFLVTITSAVTLSILPAAPAYAGIAGSWYGVYKCGSVSEMWLDLAKDGNDIWGTMRFRTGDGTTGSFKMVGKIAMAGNFYLEGVEWVRQPDNFTMVDLSGEISLNGQKIIGEVKTEGCEAFGLWPRPDDKPRPE